MADLLRRYEAGEYGLAEAISELKAARAELAARERQLEEVCRAASRAEMAVNETVAENEFLRRKLNIAPEEQIDLDGFKRQKMAQQEEERSLNLVLQKEIEALEDERLALKRQLRTLARKTGNEAGTRGEFVDDALISGWGISCPEGEENLAGFNQSNAMREVVLIQGGLQFRPRIDLINTLSKSRTAAVQDGSLTL
ncbi:unnamed protein product [Protopolystoma xenopodis]|uniref:Uncharacterized protein n=1 Tax=Protopolystoma xenopodis TaxID=117903 RepID=A0A3S5B2I1_9PLAT|nr:unnamed protein product [Protopolystoma xenopodis]